MGKVMPLAILMVMITLLFISWGNISKYNTRIKAQFNGYMTAAQEYEDKQIYVDAVMQYEKAFSLKPDDYDLAVKIKDLYATLNNGGQYIEQYLAACEKLRKMNPEIAENHYVLINYYWDQEAYDTAYEYLKAAQKHLPDDEEIKAKIRKIKGMYTTMSVGHEEFKGWCFTEENQNGTAVVVTDGKYGIVKSNNNTLLECIYEGAGPLADGVFAIKVKGEYYYADTSGNRKVVPDEPAEYLGPFNNGLALTKVGGLYGYIDKKGKSQHIQFEEAGSFSNGVAPVKLEGKWVMIDKNFNVVKNLVFEDILMDEYGFCSVYGVFFGKMDGKYHLYDVKGNNLSAAHCDGFEDAKLFASTQPAAVKSDGKWGYVNINGSIAMKPTFEDADSFNFGYGPFKENGKWGCISMTGERWIEPTFDHMSAFARNGLAQVEINGSDQFLKLNYYD